MNWAIMEYETGRHTALPNSLGRYGVACVIPMIEEYQKQDKRKVTRPALPRLLFLPAEEDRIRLILDRVRYAEKVWRDTQGSLLLIPDRDLQDFLSRLEVREKKVKSGNRSINLGSEAEQDWFDLYASKFGRQAAIKRFGTDFLKDAA